MNVPQCRMARAGLNWTLDDLAERSGVARRTIAKFETGGNVLPEKVEALRQCLAAAGVEFINGGKRHGVTVTRRD